jgi:hypothetical protein
MPDPDDRSEQLDADKLGDDPSRDDVPGTDDFPPDRSLGVEDPSLYGDDDLVTRAELRRDVGGAAGTGEREEVVLVDPYPAGVRDLDESLAGDAVEPPDADLAAEEAAVHIVDADAGLDDADAGR